MTPNKVFLVSSILTKLFNFLLSCSNGSCERYWRTGWKCMQLGFNGPFSRLDKEKKRKGTPLPQSMVSIGLHENALPLNITTLLFFFLILYFLLNSLFLSTVWIGGYLMDLCSSFWSYLWVSSCFPLNMINKVYVCLLGLPFYHEMYFQLCTIFGLCCDLALMGFLL